MLAGRTCSGKAWCHANCQIQRAVSRGATHRNFDLTVRAKDGREVCTNISIIAVPHRRRRLTVHIARQVECRDRYKEALGRIRDLIRESGILNGALTQSDGENEAGADEPGALSPLTSREIEVLALVAQGFPNAAIGRQLCISSFTVRNHVQSVLGKLGIHSKSEAVCFAYKRHLLQ
jgi:DNA-binding CsgD family transcriptional regulator